jgi:hypothetical protein
VRELNTVLLVGMLTHLLTICSDIAAAAALPNYSYCFFFLLFFFFVFFLSSLLAAEERILRLA